MVNERTSFSKPRAAPPWHPLIRTSRILFLPFSFFLSDVRYRYYVKLQFCHVRRLREALFASKNLSLLRMLPPSLRKMPHKEHGENRSVRKRVRSQSYVLVPGITVKTRSIIPALQPVGLIIIRMYGVRYEISGRRCAERKPLSGSTF